MFIFKNVKVISSAVFVFSLIFSANADDKSEVGELKVPVINGKDVGSSVQGGGKGGFGK